MYYYAIIPSPQMALVDHSPTALCTSISGSQTSRTQTYKQSEYRHKRSTQTLIHVHSHKCVWWCSISKVVKVVLYCVYYMCIYCYGT